MGNFDPMRILMSLLVFIPAITIHEYCHAKFADMAGDMTPRSQGRVTLNPLSHLDPLGTIMMVISSIAGFGIGWGKPVMVNVGKMKNPRWDHFVSVVMGPVSNLCLALVFAIYIRVFGISQEALGSYMPGSPIKDFFGLFILESLIINLSLFFFNLIPLGPLDGHWLVGAFLPPPQRNAWYQFCHGPGMFIFLILVLIPIPGFNPIGSYMNLTVGNTLKFMLGIN